MKPYRSIITITFFISAILLGLYLNSSNYKNKVVCDLYLSFKNSQFSSLIEEKFLDSNHHMNKTIVISEREIIFTLDKSDLYDFINVGDSLVKTHNDPNVIVFRNNELIGTFLIDFGCEGKDE